MVDYQDILEFWLGTTELSAEIERQEIWFRSTAEFDAEIREKFEAAWQAAARGELDHWMGAPDSCAALIVLLDQFPRNMFRGQERAFSTDPKARIAANRIVEHGWDKGFGGRVRTFCYLPFEHSEFTADQDRSVSLMAGVDEERALQAAEEHRDAILRFGRFPHRNAALGRTNTPEEEEYLKDPPGWGKTAAEAAELERKKAETEEPS